MSNEKLINYAKEGKPQEFSETFAQMAAQKILSKVSELRKTVGAQVFGNKE